MIFTLPEIDDQVTRHASRVLLAQFVLGYVLYASVPLFTGGAVINQTSLALALFFTAMYLLWRVKFIEQGDEEVVSAAEVATVPGVFIGLVTGSAVMSAAYAVEFDLIATVLLSMIAGMLATVAVPLYLRYVSKKE